MGKTTIPWCDYTFNPWWGCKKISPGCINCYAEKLDRRFSPLMSHWGQPNFRRFFDNPHWNEPLKWNKQAIETGQNRTVFCGSMCDIFEDNQALEFERKRLWQLIEKTDGLTWLLLTKRPENIQKFVPVDWLTDMFPVHVWLGVTVENQGYINRLAQLSEFTVQKFVSVEPILAPVNFGDWWYMLNWVITGPENGPGSRAALSEWMESLQRECRYRHIPFFFKGWNNGEDTLLNGVEYHEFPF